MTREQDGASQVASAIYGMTLAGPVLTPPPDMDVGGVRPDRSPSVIAPERVAHLVYVFGRDRHTPELSARETWV